MIVCVNLKCVKFFKINNLPNQLYSHYHLQFQPNSLGLYNSTRFLSFSPQVKKIFSIAWPNDRSFKYKICASMLCLAASKCSGLLVPLSLASFVNKVSKLSLINENKINQNDLFNTENDQIYKILNFDGLFDIALCLGGYGLSRVFASGFSELRNSIFTSVSEGTCRHMATESFLRIHTCDLNFIHSTKSGEIASIFNRGTRAISQLLHTIVFQALPTCLEFFMVTGLLFYKLGLETALTTISTMVAYILFTTILTRMRISIRKNLVYAEQSSMGLLVDSLTNAETVRVCNALKFETDNYSACLKEYEKHAVNSQQSLSALNFGQQFIFNLGLIASMGIATLKIINGDASPGELILVNTLLFQLSLPLNMMGTTYRQIKLSMVDLNKFSDMLLSSPIVADNKPPLAISNGSISFKNVSFKNLKNVNFDIEGGSFIAIVGYSGCGKTTLAKLLLGLYSPNSGSIHIDDKDISDYSLTSLRNQIAMVPQETVLFNNTIAYNIAYGLSNVTEAEIHAAALIAGIHYTIMSFPNKYNTEVGERGLLLSGGEKQRIGIARALIRNPKILVFDEATSSLDTLTEEQILNSFRKLRYKRTLIAISHRLTFAHEADSVIVIDNGQIVQHGSHDKLINTEGLYRKLWHMDGSATATNQAKV